MFCFTCLESFLLGVSISWWGYSPGEFPGNSTTATWQVDDDPVQTFIVRGHGDGGTSYNIKFFETPSYSYGSHRLTVIHKGNGQLTPLNLVTLLVQNGTVPGSGVAKPDDSPTTRSTPTAAIVGGAVAGGLVLVIAILLFVMFRRRKKSKKSRKEPEVVDPIAPEPFIYNPTPPILPSTNMSVSPDNLSSARGKHSLAPQRPPTILTYSGNNRPTPVGSYGGEEVQSVEYSADSTSQSVPYSQRGHSPRRPLKAQEAEAESRAPSPSTRIPQPLHSGGTLSDSYPSPTPGGGVPISGPARIVVHQDSGVRLQRPTEVPVIDIPPQYTPG